MNQNASKSTLRNRILYVLFSAGRLVAYLNQGDLWLRTLKWGALIALFFVVEALFLQRPPSTLYRVTLSSLSVWAFGLLAEPVMFWSSKQGENHAQQTAAGNIRSRLKSLSLFLTFFWISELLKWVTGGPNASDFAEIKQRDEAIIALAEEAKNREFIRDRQAASHKRLSEVQPNWSEVDQAKAELSSEVCTIQLDPKIRAVVLREESLLTADIIEGMEKVLNEVALLYPSTRPLSDNRAAERDQLLKDRLQPYSDRIVERFAELADIIKNKTASVASEHGEVAQRAEEIERESESARIAHSLLERRLSRQQGRAEKLQQLSEDQIDSLTLLQIKMLDIDQLVKRHSALLASQSLAIQMSDLLLSSLPSALETDSAAERVAVVLDSHYKYFGTKILVVVSDSDLKRSLNDLQSQTVPSITDGNDKQLVSQLRMVVEDLEWLSDPDIFIASQLAESPADALSAIEDPQRGIVLTFDDIACSMKMQRLAEEVLSQPVSAITALASEERPVLFKEDDLRAFKRVFDALCALRARMVLQGRSMQKLRLKIE